MRRLQGRVSVRARRAGAHPVGSPTYRPFGNLIGMDQRPDEVVAAYFAAVNARDFEALAGLFAEDAVLRPVGSRVREGRSDVAAYYPPLLAGFASGVDTPVRTTVAGRVVTVEIRFEGRSVDGADVAFDAVDIFDVDDDGRIARLSLWYDTRDVVRQLRAVTT